ncbi:hypothetical protein MJO29_006714 [Puccinia striiformis f. sp. tritici]|nr:hypothetical protein MJO29_006714 [Puccinia striiformis f. sp. tritici]
MDWITHCPELATPVTGWKQLKELFQEGLDPYDSGVFHQSPLLLHLFSFIHSHPFSSPLAYGLVDCYSAWIFYLFSPLNVSTSLSKSTVVFNNLAVLLALDGALRSSYSCGPSSRTLPNRTKGAEILVHVGLYLLQTAWPFLCSLYLWGLI